MREATPQQKRNIGIVLGALLVLAVVLFAVTRGLGQPSVPSGAVAEVDQVDDGVITEEALTDQLAEQTGGEPPEPGDEGFDEAEARALQVLLQGAWTQGEAEERSISDEEIEAAIAQAAPQFGLEEIPEPGDEQYEQIRNVATLGLVQQRWRAEEAEARGVSVTEEDVEERFQEIAAAEGWENERQIERGLRQFGFEDREAALDQVRDILNREGLAEAGIDRSEIERIYDANIERFERPASRDVRLILNDDEERVQRALERLSEDDSEESWQRIADRFSQDQASKDRGGLLPEVTEEDDDALDDPFSLPEEDRGDEFNEQVFAAEVGELVGPFETDRGFFVIQVVEARDGALAGLGDESPVIPGQTLEEELRERLVSAQAQRIDREFQTSLEDKWVRRTVCTSELARRSPTCRNHEPEFEAPAGKAGKLFAEAPVRSTQPIAPGSAIELGTLIGEDNPQFGQIAEPFLGEQGRILQRMPGGSDQEVGQPLPQRPVRVGDPCDDGDDPVPCGAEDAQFGPRDLLELTTGDIESLTAEQRQQFQQLVGRFDQQQLEGLSEEERQQLQQVMEQLQPDPGLGDLPGQPGIPGQP